MRTTSEAFWFATRHIKLNSRGSYELVVGEFIEEDSNLSAWKDPVPAQGSKPADDAHAIVDFNQAKANLSNKAFRKLGRRLRNRARKAYTPPNITAASKTGS